MKDSQIVDLASRKLAPFVLLFGLYLIAYGHISPGGGFQGGVVIASGVVLLALGRGIRATHSLLPGRSITVVELTAFSCLVFLPFVGLAVGGYFFADFLPQGSGQLLRPASQVFVLNILIGIKVAAGVTLIYYYLFELQEE